MKTSVLIFLIVLSSFGLKAQQPKGQSPEIRSERIVSMFKNTLNLTDQQNKKLLQIYTNHYKSTDSLLSVIIKQEPNGNATRSALDAMYLEAQLAIDKEIISVLNDDQKFAYAKLVSSRKTVTLSAPSPPPSR